MNDKNNTYREEYYNDTYSGEEEYDTATNNDSVYSHDNRRREEKSKKVNKRKKHFFNKIIFKLLAFILALFIVVLAIGYVLSLFIPQTTHVLIMATDAEGTRTDTIMLASFDKKEKKLSFLSIPRDTYITVDDETYAIMREDFPEPGSKSMKINTVHHFGGEKHGVDFLKNEVSKLLNVNIDFYVKLDFDAFRYIIDSVGGIDFNVPRNMKYTDPYQDLYIDLKEGMQHLNGEEAEHLLRYRSGYANADIGRINVQLDFVKEFISQTLSKGTILSHPSAYINAIFKYDYLETDAKFFDIVSYSMLLGGIKTENIDTTTLPGIPAMRQGQSVYLPKVSEFSNKVSKIASN